jgi:hypothetical protein
MQVCTTVAGQTVVIASPSPVSPSQTAMHTSASAAVLDLGEHREPELRALATDAAQIPSTSRRPSTVTPMTT